MALTPLGKALRKLRIDRGLKLFNMANELNTSAAFLSAVEHGRKSVPADLVNKVVQAYGLDFIAAAELQQAAELSDRALRIDLHGTRDVSRELALVFSRNFDKLTERDAKMMLQMFSSVGEKPESGHE